MARIAALGAALILGVALTSVAPAGAAPAAVSAANPDVQSAIAAAVEKERVRFGGATPVPGVMVGVWDGNGGSYARAFGAADLATGRPLTPDDHFRIGSNTKTFLISVVLQLVDEGKLRLDDPISRFSLGVTIPNDRHITVRELCQMRSGLFEAYSTPEINRLDIKPDMTFDAQTLIGWAVKQKPYFPPGTAYKYSNTNYLILGLLVEYLTKDTVADQINKRLLAPFKLTQTSYPATQEMPEPWAHGYELDNGAWKDISGTIPVSMMGAAGEMVSDPADMKRWVKLYVGGKTNGKATQRARLTCIPTGEGNFSFGLGIGCDAGWYGYTGGLPGYNTGAYYFPATGITIIAWVTLQHDTPEPGVANSIVRDIAAIMTPGAVPFVVKDSAAKPGEK